MKIISRWFDLGDVVRVRSYWRRYPNTPIRAPKAVPVVAHYRKWPNF